MSPPLYPSNSPLSDQERDGHRYVDYANRVGSRVQLLVAREDRGPRFLLPASAIVSEEGHSFVYVSHGGHYDRVELRVESDHGHFVVVPVDGELSEGDEVAPFLLARLAAKAIAYAIAPREDLPPPAKPVGRSGGG